MALTKNSTVVFPAEAPEFMQSLPVDAVGNAGGGIVYAGSFLGWNGTTGYVRRFQASDKFAGLAKRYANNSGTGTPLDPNGTNLGDGTAGGTVVPALTKGHFYWQGTITGLTGAQADARGSIAVYCTDDGTLNTTQGTGDLVGYITAWCLTNYGNNKWEITLANQTEHLI